MSVVTFDAYNPGHDPDPSVFILAIIALVVLILI